MIYVKIFINSDLKIMLCFNTSVAKCVDVLKLYATVTHFYNASINIGSISFFSSFDALEPHHLWGCHAIVINSSLNPFQMLFVFQT